MIRPWRSAKCSGMSFQPAAPKKYGPPISIAIQRTQRAPCSAPSGKRGGDQDAARDRGRDPEAARRLAKVRVVVARDPEQGDVGGPDDRVGDREDERRVVEGAGHADRRDQEPRHRGEDDEAHRALLGVDDAGEPRVADPRPPQDREHEEALRDALPGRLVSHQLRALRDREDEDEVEEELERRHRLALPERRAHPARPCARPALHHGPKDVRRFGSVVRVEKALADDAVSDPLRVGAVPAGLADVKCGRSPCACGRR